MNDTTFGCLLIVLSVGFGTYYTAWVIGLPFFDRDHFIHNLFPSVHLALLIPALMGLAFIGSLIVFCVIALRASSSVSIMSKWIVVAISGVTCGGKTTLSNRLHEYYAESVKLCQDDYFYPVDSPHHVKCLSLNHINWELMSALDMISMKSDINNIISQDPSQLKDLPPKATRSVKINDSVNPQSRNILILDGFLILNDPDIVALSDLCYFLTLTREECWSRRSKRTYDPPDIPGYFDSVVWPEYVRNRDEVLKNPSVKVYDGVNPIDSVMKEVITAIDNQIILNSQ
ncbi:Nicotinamide riboside kinase 2 [Frankliniella fusca]|uniref:Dolichol phosphate-mannose biosynthesis regulatory protein n=1 Tax=Frankliniella fusca TaxID=407009 RepID=A0AAE1H8G9_9NEOP|nr:Nicotinamide riboside kinase 2 [Frankliniella fusca]